MYFNILRCRKTVCFWLNVPSLDKIGSPRCSCSRSSQGCSHSSTTNRTSTRCYGCHRTRQDTHTESPLMSRFIVCYRRKFYHNFFVLCRFFAFFPSSWKFPLALLTRREFPPNLPLRRGRPPPFLPVLLRS